MLDVPSDHLEPAPDLVGAEAALTAKRQRIRRRMSEVLKEAEDVGRLDGFEFEMTGLCIGHPSLKPLDTMDRIRLATEITLLKRKIVREVRKVKRHKGTEPNGKPQPGPASVRRGRRRRGRD